jgi:hypothetical protein
MKKEFSISGNTVLQRNKDQLFTMIDDEVVMLNVKQEEYLNLNHHASYIWQKLETPHTFAELTEQLCKAFDVEKHVCVEDTYEFLTAFVEKNIIQIIGE